MLAVLFFILQSSFSCITAQPLSEQEIIQRMAAAAGEIQLPDKLRWEYLSPRAKTILLDNSKSLPTRNGMEESVARLIMNSVTGRSLTDSSMFQVTAEEKPTEYVATLIPLRKEMKRIFTKLVLHFDLKQSTVTKVELHEKNGDQTVIELHDIRIN